MITLLLLDGVTKRYRKGKAFIACSFQCYLLLKYQLCTAKKFNYCQQALVSVIDSL